MRTREKRFHYILFLLILTSNVFISLQRHQTCDPLQLFSSKVSSFSPLLIFLTKMSRESDLGVCLHFRFLFSSSVKKSSLPMMKNFDPSFVASLSFYLSLFLFPFLSFSLPFFSVFLLFCLYFFCLFFLFFFLCLSVFLSFFFLSFFSFFLFAFFPHLFFLSYL